MAEGNKERIGVVGSGVMGRGIVQLFATAGHEVWLHDSREGASEEALGFIDGLLERSVTKGRLSEKERDATLARLHVADSVAGLADCDLVIEAIVENLEAKQGLLCQLEGVVASEAILASNTSSLSVTRLASACRHPERVAGFHFFNPVPLMKVVEVVRGERTRPAVIERLERLARQAGHFPAVTPDTPGFLVNHAGRAYAPEALRLLDEGIASPEQIDRILCRTLGFRMGPFELLDLIGLDVTHAVMESVYRQFYDDPLYMPSWQVPRRLAAGLLGRKSGEGFYRYADGKRLATENSPPPAVPVTRPFWLDRQEPEWRERIASLVEAAGSWLEQGASPSAEAICLVTPVGETVSACIAERGLPAERTLALETLAGFDACRVLMSHPAIEAGVLAQATSALGSDDVPVEVIHDSPGFVAQRILAFMVNIGAEIVRRGIAEPATLDKAVKLALGYPEGPLAFGDRYGGETFVRVLGCLHDHYGEARYRLSPWLKQRLQLSLPLCEGG
ncbi:3-hydroxyacyl-CoA dehydrogenase [Modicisalibacter sp. 'Wilcox']|uniref:3-hydroxyacyl-CoA dehydrogenase n=1 Tax=Modicisalibacter sp. 'Wilcox' TaxID=2679914 RepID=UPI0013CF94BA|nr:3-hydroxyacyl-CoA dehydrogenase [Modicisalibacter sp. 'Wilcox']